MMLRVLCLLMLPTLALAQQPNLELGLASSDPRERSLALNRLRGMGSAAKPHLEATVALLGDYQSQHQAMSTLQGLGQSSLPAMPHIVRLLQTTRDTKTIDHCLKWLGSHPVQAKAAVPRVIELSRIGMRQAASCLAIFALHHERAFEVLINLCRHRSGQIRQLAIGRLGEFVGTVHEEEAVEVLLVELRQEDENRSNFALSSLHKFAGCASEAPAILLDLIETGNPWYREYRLQNWQLHGRARADLAPRLIAFIGDREDEIAVQALHALRITGAKGSAAVRGFYTGLYHPSARVREHAIFELVLSELRHLGLLQVVVDSLLDGAPAVEAAAELAYLAMPEVHSRLPLQGLVQPLQQRLDRLRQSLADKKSLVAGLEAEFSRFVRDQRYQSSSHDPSETRPAVQLKAMVSCGGTEVLATVLRDPRGSRFGIELVAGLGPQALDLLRVLLAESKGILPSTVSAVVKACGDEGVELVVSGIDGGPQTYLRLQVLEGLGRESNWIVPVLRLIELESARKERAKISALITRLGEPSVENAQRAKSLLEPLQRRYRLRAVAKSKEVDVEDVRWVLAQEDKATRELGIRAIDYLGPAEKIEFYPQIAAECMRGSWMALNSLVKLLAQDPHRIEEVLWPFRESIDLSERARASVLFGWSKGEVSPGMLIVAARDPWKKMREYRPGELAPDVKLALLKQDLLHGDDRAKGAAIKDAVASSMVDALWPQIEVAISDAKIAQNLTILSALGKRAFPQIEAQLGRWQSISSRYISQILNALKSLGADAAPLSSILWKTLRDARVDDRTRDRVLLGLVRMELKGDLRQSLVEELHTRVRESVAQGRWTDDFVAALGAGQFEDERLLSTVIQMTVRTGSVGRLQQAEALVYLGAKPDVILEFLASAKLVLSPAQGARLFRTLARIAPQFSSPEASAFLERWLQPNYARQRGASRSAVIAFLEGLRPKALLKAVGAMAEKDILCRQVYAVVAAPYAPVSQALTMGAWFPKVDSRSASAANTRSFLAGLGQKSRPVVSEFPHLGRHADAHLIWDLRGTTMDTESMLAALRITADPSDAMIRYLVDGEGFSADEDKQAHTLLARLGEKGVTALLATHTSDEQREVIRWALQAALRDPDPKVWRPALVGIEAKGFTGSLLVGTLLQSTDKLAKCEAIAAALHRAGKPLDFPIRPSLTYMPGMVKGSAPVRAVLIELSPAVPERRFIHLVIDACFDPVAMVRIAAAKRLAGFGSKAAVAKPFLTRMLTDEDVRVVQAAEAALKALAR